ncbi:MAG: T9SS type A sorting domain-containing protein [Bacteroidetes bacterium]|nr:T9SS type A sorting domain-containing protein [Bacteroidota bacterium]
MRAARFFLLLSVSALSAGLSERTATGQFAITSASIADGQSNVQLVDSIYFYFNQQLPFNTLFSSKFHWEPYGHFQRTEVFLNTDRQSPRFRLIHQQEYDFSVYVFGVASAGNQRMQRPFALNYTTSATAGSRQVGGSVSFGQRLPTSGPAISALIREHALRTPGPTNVASTSVPQTAARAEQKHANKAASTATTLANNLDYTVILLLDQFAIDEGIWSVRAAAAITQGGTYSFGHVRPGTYYPIAFNYTDDTGEAIGHYGYYDPNGDYAPDPITVSGGNLSGIDLTLYPYGPQEGLQWRDIAKDAAAAVASDAALLNMNTSVALDGSASNWTYLFRSISQNIDIFVSVDPLTLSTATAASSYNGTVTSIPRFGVIDSGAAVTVAEQNGGSTYRTANPGPLTIAAVGGNLLAEFPTAPDHLLWRISYSVAGGSNAPFVVYVDMITGEPYETLPIELSDLHALQSEESVVLRWSARGELRPNSFVIQEHLPSDKQWIDVTRFDETTSNGPAVYSATVGNVDPGTHTYRVRHASSGGTSTYSASVEIAVRKMDRLTIGTPYPNPTSGNSTIRIYSRDGGSASVRLLDLLGRTVGSQNVTDLTPDAVTEITLASSLLPTGIYLVEVTTDGVRKTTRFTVSR